MQTVLSYECIGVFVSGSCDVILLVFSIPVVQCNCENKVISCFTFAMYLELCKLQKLRSQHITIVIFNMKKTV